MLNITEPKIDPDEVRKKYNEMSLIWDKNDKWHSYTYKTIRNYIHDFFSSNEFSSTIHILNAGSGGNDYGINQYAHFHIDIAEDKLKNVANAIIANIESIPENENQFDVCICVGSVINYCDAFRVIKEFHRILKPGGYLILEFENSKSFEFALMPAFNKGAYIVETFYNGNIERLWVYSEKYIKNILNNYNLLLKNINHFHNLSPFFYRLLKDESKASLFSGLDKIASLLPFIRTWSANIILTCQKTS